MIYAILIASYVIPFFLNWKYVQLAYSKKGIYDKLNPDIYDLFFTITPLINILYMSQWVFNYPIEQGACLNKFFKVKK